MIRPEVIALVIGVIALAIPVSLALVAMTSPRHAAMASSASLGLALLFNATAGVAPHASRAAAASLGVRVDLVTCVMLLLVSGIGLVIVRYSRTYLEGEPGLPRYLRWLLMTLSAVTALVLANNLLVLALAWTATSLALHQLLTFYPDRAAALVAAHKKFLVSRLADLSLVGCVALVYLNVGSLELDAIESWVGAHPGLTPQMHVASLLVVFAVVLKSAQLPFHGWLIQVMEAPTPVSALLHAGVVNIGGFVLIRLAPWMAHAEFAQCTLVIIGLASAITAPLVMTTRVSIKVALAWSTCAQMGFMLVQCGLGLWHLALLHLVAHSLYKAHAFLSAGTAVDSWRVQAHSKPSPVPTLTRLGLASALAVGSAVLGVSLLWASEWAPRREFSVPVLAGLVALSMVPVIARPSTGFRATAHLVARGASITALYVGWHMAAERLVPTPLVDSSLLAWALVALGFIALFVLKTALQSFPAGPLARALHPWLFAGLYLDEVFTRLTFRVWPLRSGRPSASDFPSSLPARVEVGT